MCVISTNNVKMNLHINNGISNTSVHILVIFLGYLINQYLTNVWVLQVTLISIEYLDSKVCVSRLWSQLLIIYLVSRESLIRKKTLFAQGRVLIKWQLKKYTDR